MTNAPIVIEASLHAPVSMVWKALTHLEDLRQWYFDIKAFKPEVDFTFHFYGGDEEKQYLHLCRITEAEVNKKLSYTWAYENIPVETLVTFELFAEGEQTNIRLTHTGVDQFPAGDPNFARESFVEGWTQIIRTSLKEYVEQKQPAKSVAGSASA